MEEGMEEVRLDPRSYRRVVLQDISGSRHVLDE